MPPVIAFVLSAAGAALIARILVREWKRVSTDLERVRSSSVSRSERDRLPTLRRDPRTGEFRP